MGLQAPTVDEELELSHQSVSFPSPTRWRRRLRSSQTQYRYALGLAKRSRLHHSTDDAFCSQTKPSSESSSNRYPRYR